MTDLYGETCAARLDGEGLDCAVIAVAISCRVPYATAHALFEKAGRRKGGRTPRHMTEEVLDALGFEWVKFKPRQKNGSGYTPKTIGAACRGGHYMAYVKSHVLAVVNGEVQDWTKNRTHRVKYVWRIIKKGRFE